MGRKRGLGNQLVQEEDVEPVDAARTHQGFHEDQRGSHAGPPVLREDPENGPRDRQIPGIPLEVINEGRGVEREPPSAQPIRYSSQLPRSSVRYRSESSP